MTTDQTINRTIESAEIDRVLAEAVRTGAVPHVAAIVADRDGILYEGGSGMRVAGGSNDLVGTSTQFRIMSMTKLMCTAAALQQRDRGDLDFDAPVAEYCPEFAEVKVLHGFDGDEPILRQPASQASVKHLVTHTSGLAYWFWNADLVKYEAAAGIPNVVPGITSAFQAPMVVDPGTQFVYGINLDWLGKVVESVAGRGLDDVIREGITEPLAMNDTMFRLDEARTANCVGVHARDENGRWMSVGEVLNQDPDWWSGGHGLYSTPRDYIRFQRALLRGGELDGSRILAESTVDEAFRNQIGDLDFPAEILTADPPITDTMCVGAGHKWGYGLLLNTDDVPGRRRAGTGAWSGLLNTHFFIDRTSGVCASIYTNSLPFITRDQAWKLYVDFETAVYAAL
jgi:CubicO group peptidase (beta-lactamase class C family)